MKLTLTAKVQLYPTSEQATLLQQTVEAYHRGGHDVSRRVYDTHNLQQAALLNEAYRPLRTPFGLRSQMAQSVIKTVIAWYKSMRVNGYLGTRMQCTYSALDLVWNRDDSLKAHPFSLATLHGRIPPPARDGGGFDGTWPLGTDHLVHRHGRWFLHVPMTQEIAATDLAQIRQVVGLDSAINFFVTADDSSGQTTFFPGRAVNARRAHFKMRRQALQRRQPPLAGGV